MCGVNMSFPKKIEFYLHADDDNYYLSQKLGLSEEATETFRGTGYEVVFTLLVEEDGTNICTHLNGVELSVPVRI